MNNINTFLKLNIASGIALIAVFLFTPTVSFAGIYVPPVPAPPPLPTVPNPNPPVLPTVPNPVPPTIPTLSPIPPTIPTSTVPTPPTLPVPPGLPVPPTLPSPTPTPPVVVPPTIPTPPVLPPIPINPIPPPLPPGIPTPTPPVPLANGFLSIWTDGYATAITSGSRNIGDTEGINKLKWSSNNSTFCEGDGFNASGNPAGEILSGHASLLINPGDTNVYGIRCKNSANIWSGWHYVTVIKDITPLPPANAAPENPIIKGADMSTSAPIGVTINGQAIFTFKASDPDGDQVAYLIDWDKDSVTDLRLPTANYINSGTTQTVNYSWSTLGSKSFQVRAIDDKGNLSGWTEHSIVVTDATVTPPAPPQISLAVDKSLIRTGEQARVTVKITANYLVGCDIYGVLGGPIHFSHSGGLYEVITSYDTNILNAAQTIRLECTPNVAGFTLQQEVRQARVDVVPEVQEI